jgi:hypothetical protein
VPHVTWQGDPRRNNHQPPSLRAGGGRIELFIYIVGPAGLVELLFCLWLLVFGVNAQRWKQQAAQQ